MDSSPLRGVDWMNTEVVSVSQQNLIAASRAQKRAAAARQELRGLLKGGLLERAFSDPKLMSN